jgi:hypothetical protein
MTYQSTWYRQQDDLAVAPRSLFLTSYLLRTGVFEYSIRRIRILKKWKKWIRIRIRRIRIRIGKLEFDSREL